MAVSDTTVAIAAATAYIKLENDAHAAITGLTWQLCTMRPITRLKQNRYQAVFEAGNGYTIDGTDLVTHVSLWSAGGALLLRKALSTGYCIPKWKTTRIIVEFMCWDGT
jgi:hypothetical protein